MYHDEGEGLPEAKKVVIPEGLGVEVVRTGFVITLPGQLRGRGSSRLIEDPDREAANPYLGVVHFVIHTFCGKSPTLRYKPC